MTLPGALLAVDAHVAVVVLQPGSGNKTERTYLSTQSTPGPSRRIQVWVESNDDCEAVIAGFDAAGGLAYPDMPVLASLKGGETKIPGEREGWEWNTADRLRELDVVFLSAGSGEEGQLKHLAEVLRGPSASGPLRKRQVAELRKTIDALSARNASGSDYTVKVQPESLSGVFRGMECDWCRSAQKVSLAAGAASVVRQRFP